MGMDGQRDETKELRVTEHLDSAPIDAESVSDTVYVENWPGSTLAQKLENAISENGSSKYRIPQDNDGSVWAWDKSVTVSQNYIEIVGTKRVDIDYTLGSASGALLELTGSRQYVEGLSFQASGTENPDHGIFLNGTGEQEATDCFVADASTGFEVSGWKSRFHGCRTNNTSADGFLISGPNNAMTRCFAKNAGRDGIHANSAHSPTIAYCSSDSPVRYACNIENGVNGYVVIGLTVEGGQTGGTSTDALINLADNGTSGMYAGGFLDDKANTRRGFNISGGNHAIHGTRMLSVDGDNFRLASTSSSGRLGVQHPYVHVTGTDPANVSWVDDSVDAELSLEGGRVLKHNLSGVSGEFVGQVRVDNGTNTAGGGLSCRWTGSAWQPSDGSTTFT